MPATLPFRKMNGLGNEIVVVDLRGRKEAFTTAAAHAVAERPASHFDQMMVLHDPRQAGTEAYIRIYNTDGSEVEACGNGMRCVGWLVAGQTGRKALKFETKAGVLDVQVKDIAHITVDMGTPEVRLEGHSARRAVPRHQSDRAADRADRQADPAFAIGGQCRQPACGVLGR